MNIANRLRLSPIGRLNLITVPLVLMGAGVGWITFQSLRANSAGLVEAHRIKQMAAESLSLVWRQDDMSKTLMLDPDDPNAGKEKIRAYDRNAALFERMKKMSADSEIAALINRIHELDDKELRDIDMQVLEALGEGRAEAGKKLYFQSYVPARARYEKLVRQLGDRAEAVAVAEERELARKNTASLRNIGAALAAGIAFVGLCAYWLAEGLRRHLRSRIAELRDRARAIHGSGGELDSTSSGLAEDATSCAAQLEETSAALEQIASMTSANADTAGQALDLARRSKAQTDQAAGEVKSLMATMAEIRLASQKVSRIAKTVDDVAFHTNILALNAAVEAARAGEAGAGFAVVAQEVRSLSQKSAESARETAELVQEAIQAAERGVSLSERVGQALDGVFESSEQIGELIARVAAANGEQNQGVQSVNDAMRRIDRITQDNARRADQGVECAQRLGVNASELDRVVVKIRSLVETDSSRSEATA